MGRLGRARISRLGGCGSMRYAVCGLRYAVCGLRSAFCGICGRVQERQ